MPTSSVNLKELLFLVAAPMAGISSPIFRSLCRRLGASLAFTEMISARGLLSDNRKTRELLAIRSDERPAGAQIFGTDPSEMAEAAARIESAGFDLVDINMGCPVRKVVSTGAGAALMNDIPLAARIVSSMVARVRIPVTAKIRSGWSLESINAVELSQTLEREGLSAIIVHPRTRDQGYAGRAEWPLIGTVRQAVSIPVIGNGDVTSGEEGRALMESTGCDGIMIGRAALGYPWIFMEVRASLDGGPRPPKPGAKERYAWFITHFRGLRSECGPMLAALKMKRLASYYIRGQRGAPAARGALHRARTAKIMIKIVKDVLLNGGAAGIKTK
jgi:nifR3 family TIM-barrel protein